MGIDLCLELLGQQCNCTGFLVQVLCCNQGVDVDPSGLETLSRRGISSQRSSVVRKLT